MWAVRSLPGSDGSVRLGHLSSGGGAFVGESEDEQGENVDEYEVLLDDGAWAPSQDGDLDAAGALACGRLADGTPLYFSLGDPWGEGARAPLETRAQNDWHVAHEVLLAPSGAEASAAPAGPQDATDYRWGSASGGEIPADAVGDGHGSRWRDTEDGGQEPQTLWLIRAQLPDGSVQLGWAARGGPARVGTPHATVEVDAYEVLLDAGEWRWPEPDEEDCFDFAAAGGVVGGRLADGSPLYATVRDREGEGYEPGGRGARHGMDFNYKVLVAPAAVPSDAPAPASAQPEAGAPPAPEPEAEAPAAPEPEAAAPAAAEPEPAGPTVVVRALDLRGEVVEIANTGGAPVDIAGWRLHDEGSTKGYVFPPGTVLEAGASVRVRSGPGAASTGPGELKWKTASVWNDTGDTAFLKDPSGELVDSKKA
jgi:hypothetical protein